MEDQSGAVALPLPGLQIRRLHPGHPEPAAAAAGAQLHLHVPQHRAGGGPGEGEEAQGAFARFPQRMKPRLFFIPWFHASFFFFFSNPLACRST